MGNIISKVQSDEIDFQDWSRKFDEFDSGAVTWFIGNVRKMNKSFGDEYREVRAITYESYEVLAEKVLHDICIETQEKFGKDLNLIVVHRTGYLEVGECSIIIGVSSFHRGPAFEASRYIIEEVKKRAPIWKLEHYASGQSEWLKGQSLNEL